MPCTRSCGAGSVTSETTENSRMFSPSEMMIAAACASTGPKSGARSQPSEGRNTSSIHTVAPETMPA